MPVNRSRVALKTLLLAPATPIEVWGVQQLLGGDPVAGIVAITIGMALVGAYVVIQEYDIPYERTLREVATEVADHVDSEDVADAATDAASDTSDAVRQDD